MTWRVILVLAMLSGGFLCSQLPAFAQHYHQRLAGRLDLAQQRAAEITNDAQTMDLSVEAYIDRFLSSPDHSLEGRRMQDSLHLARQLGQYEQSLRQAAPLTLPILILGQFDSDLAQDAYALYRPQLPLDPQGLAYALIGGLIGLLAMFAGRRAAKFGHQAARRKEAVE